MTQATADIRSVTHAFYTEVDANDPEVFARRFAADGEFAFNDEAPVTGPEAIAGFVGAWKGNFRSVTHELTGLTVDDEQHRVGVEIVVLYVFPDGREISVKGCSFLDFAGESIRSWRVYVDTSRLV